MAKQSDIIPEIIQVVAECGAPVGLVFFGSVAQGLERADSDVDFWAIADVAEQPEFPGFAVFSEKNGCKVQQREAGEFSVHVACWTTSSMDTILRSKPYMTYPLLQGRIVHDPAGLAERCRARIRPYFTAHPTLEEAWTQQLSDLRDARAGRSGDLAFPQWSDFVRHIEDVFGEEIA